MKKTHEAYVCGMALGLSMLITTTACAQAPPATAPAAAAPTTAPAPGAAAGAPAPGAAVPGAPGAIPAPPPPAPPKIEAPRKQAADIKVASEGAAVPNVELIYAFEKKLVKLNDVLTSGKAKDARVKVVTFVNTACSSCMDEMRLLMDLAGKHGDKLALIAIVTDRNAERIADALGQEVKTAFTFLSDPYFSSPGLFGFKSTPASVIVKGAKIEKLEGGFLPTEEGRAAYIALIEAQLK